MLLASSPLLPRLLVLDLDRTLWNRPRFSRGPPFEPISGGLAGIRAASGEVLDVYPDARRALPHLINAGLPLAFVSATHRPSWTRARALLFPPDAFSRHMPSLPPTRNERLPHLHPPPPSHPIPSPQGIFLDSLRIEAVRPPAPDGIVSCGAAFGGAVEAVRETCGDTGATRFSEGALASSVSLGRVCRHLIIRDGTKAAHVRAAARASDVPLESVLYLDDRRRDVLAVRALGASAVHCPDGLTVELLCDGLRRHAARERNRQSPCLFTPDQ